MHLDFRLYIFFLGLYERRVFIALHRRLNDILIVECWNETENKNNVESWNKKNSVFTDFLNCPYEPHTTPTNPPIWIIFSFIHSEWHDVFCLTYKILLRLH